MTAGEVLVGYKNKWVIHTNIMSCVLHFVTPIITFVEVAALFFYIEHKRGTQKAVLVPPKEYTLTTRLLLIRAIHYITINDRQTTPIINTESILFT